MLNKKVVLVGYSGHGLVVADAAREQGLDLHFYVDKKAAVKNPFNLTYLGFEGDPEFDHWQKDHVYSLGIGDNLVRRKTAELILNKGVELLNVSHPRSSISPHIELGKGNFFNNNAAVNINVKIGNFCILNTGSSVEHDCILGDAVHVAPGAVVLGGVQIGDNTFIGANSVIREGVQIGKNVVVGAGSVILTDIADNMKIVGNPGRKI